MIDSLYNLTRKGWLKALSFLLAVTMFITILLKVSVFAHYFGGTVPYLAILVFYAMAILFIHGVGFDIRGVIWKAIFLPITGYLIILPTLVFLAWY